MPALVAADWVGVEQTGYGTKVPSGGAGVDVMLKQADGGYYLFAVNITEQIQTLRLGGMGWPLISGAEPLHRAPEPRWVEGRLEAELAPLGVGVYRLKTSTI